MNNCMTLHFNNTPNLILPNPSKKCELISSRRVVISELEIKNYKKMNYKKKLSYRSNLKKENIIFYNRFEMISRQKNIKCVEQAVSRLFLETNKKKGKPKFNKSEKYLV